MGNKLPRPAGVPGRLAFGAAAEGEPGGRVKEECPKEIEDPPEAVQRRSTESDEDPAQQKGEDRHPGAAASRLSALTTTASTARM